MTVAAPVAVADPPREPLPVSWSVAEGQALYAKTGAVPPGANDPSCVLTPQHPHPVVLVAGTFATAATTWNAAAPYLRNNGFCVYTVDLGAPPWGPRLPIRQVGDIPTAAADLGAHIDRVLAQTGAPKVDLVGHSVGGGVLGFYYLNVLGGHTKVDSVVGLAPSHHGINLASLLSLGAADSPAAESMRAFAEQYLPAVAQQEEGSEVLAQVYGNGDTRPGVNYTTIVSTLDEIVTPHTKQFLQGPNVTNIVLQDGCPQDKSSHVTITYSKRALALTVNALDPGGAVEVPC